MRSFRIGRWRVSAGVRRSGPWVLLAGAVWCPPPSLLTCRVGLRADLGRAYLEVYLTRRPVVLRFTDGPARPLGPEPAPPGAREANQSANADVDRYLSGTTISRPRAVLPQEGPLFPDHD